MNEIDPARLLEHLKLMVALADEFGVKRDGPAGWGFLLAYRMALKYDPRFAPSPTQKKRRGRPSYKNEIYKAKLAMAATAADAAGMSHAKMAETIAKMEMETKLAQASGGEERRQIRNTAPRAIEAAKRQIENDAAEVSPEYREIAKFLTSAIASGQPIDQVRSTLEAMGCSAMAETFLLGLEHHKNSTAK